MLSNPMSGMVCFIGVRKEESRRLRLQSVSLSWGERIGVVQGAEVEELLFPPGTLEDDEDGLPDDFIVACSSSSCSGDPLDNVVHNRFQSGSSVPESDRKEPSTTSSEDSSSSQSSDTEWSGMVLA